MSDTDAFAARPVAGGWLFLCRHPRDGSGWRVALWERAVNPHTAVAEGDLRSEVLVGDRTCGPEFATPDQAARFMRQRLAA